MGTLVENPDIRVTTSGDSMAKFSLSVERPGRSEGLPVQVDVLDVVAWRQTAELATPMLKGQTVLVEGRIITRTLEDPSGQKKYITEVEARELRSLGGQAFVESSENKQKKTSLQSTPQGSVDEFDFGSEKEGLQFPPSFEQEIEEEIPF